MMCFEGARHRFYCWHTPLWEVLRFAPLPLQSNLKCVLRVYITGLIVGWGHCGSNRRHASNWVRLLFDAPMGILVLGCILELAKIW
jgi:hypothetical protein